MQLGCGNRTCAEKSDRCITGVCLLFHGTKKNRHTTTTLRVFSWSIRTSPASRQASLLGAYEVWLRSLLSFFGVAAMWREAQHGRRSIMVLCLLVSSVHNCIRGAAEWGMVCIYATRGSGSLAFREEDWCWCCVFRLIHAYEGRGWHLQGAVLLAISRRIGQGGASDGRAWMDHGGRPASICLRTELGDVQLGGSRCWREPEEHRRRRAWAGHLGAWTSGSCKSGSGMLCGPSAWSHYTNTQKRD